MEFKAYRTLAPIQGHDVQVFVTTASGSQILVGTFTSILCRFVNVTETYLELNQRVPLHLDGEINIVWQMERGQLNMNVLQDTFGFFQGSGTSKTFRVDRQHKVPRARRFNIVFTADVSKDDFVDTEQAAMNGMIRTLSDADLRGVDMQKAAQVYHLLNCKVDTFSFGATAGRSVVANQWQGTAEGYYIN